MRHAVLIPFLTWMVACSTRHETPDWSDCPRLVAHSADRWPLPAERPLELTFTAPVHPPEDTAAAFFVPQVDGGPCNPACPVPCAAGRCFLSAVDDAFLRDAADGNLSSSRRVKAEEARIEAEGARWRLTPRWGALRPSWRYDLVLTPQVRDDQGLPLLDSGGKMAAFPVPFETAWADDLEAAVTWLAPAPGARQVPQNLAFLAVRVEGAGAGVPGLFVLETPDHRVIGLEATPFPAGCVGMASGQECWLLWIPHTLDPETTYELRTVRRVRLSGGRFLLPWGRLGTFQTGERAWAYPPEWVEEGATTVTGCVHVSGWVEGEALVWLEARGEPVAPAFRARFSRAELAARSPDVRVRGLGLEGSPFTGPPHELEPGELEAHPVALVLVHPNPVGPEPAQEFLELENLSGLPMELEGWELTDSLEKAGDLLPAFRLEPGARVRVAGKNYDPGFPGEPPAEGDLIVLDSSLANAGLGNSGEPLYLFDIYGDLVSRYGGWIDTSDHPGVSVRRTSTTACDVTTGWELR